VQAMILPKIMNNNTVIKTTAIDLYFISLPS
jgi:hypothetical protein